MRVVRNTRSRDVTDTQRHMEYEKTKRRYENEYYTEGGAYGKRVKR